MSPLSQNMSEPIAVVVYTRRQQPGILVSASCRAHRGAKLRSLSPVSFTAALLESYRPVLVGVLRATLASRIVIRTQPIADRHR
jgi:hypothetical protein